MIYQVRDVSVIIVNYNGAPVVGAAMESVLDLWTLPKELIVVDNGSTDNSRNVIREKAAITREHCDVRMIFLPNNRGVAGGRNVGMDAALGEIVAFLDSDAMATDSWLSGSLSLFEHHERVGAVAPLVLMDLGAQVNAAGSEIDEAGHGRDRYRGELYTPLAATLKEEAGRLVDYAMGCGMVLSRKAAASVFPLDESFLKWHDDTEIGLRMAKRGWETRFCESAVIYHAPGHSNPDNWDQLYHESESARFYLLLKYYSVSVIGREILGYVAVALWRWRRDPRRMQWTVRTLKTLSKLAPSGIRIRRQWRS